MLADRTSPRRDEPGSFLLDLAPSGVCRAGVVTRAAVRSYRTISPLPRRCPPARRRPTDGEAVCFLWHCPDPCGRWVLPTTASCGARTFLGAGRAGVTRPVRHRGRSVRSGRKQFYGCRCAPVQSDASRASPISPGFSPQNRPYYRIFPYPFEAVEIADLVRK